MKNRTLIILVVLILLIVLLSGCFLAFKEEDASSLGLSIYKTELFKELLNSKSIIRPDVLKQNIEIILNSDNKHFLSQKEIEFQEEFLKITKSKDILAIKTIYSNGQIVEVRIYYSE